jgi:hypothetical protein
MGRFCIIKKGVAKACKVLQKIERQGKNLELGKSCLISEDIHYKTLQYKLRKKCQVCR